MSWKALLVIISWTALIAFLSDRYWDKWLRDGRVDRVDRFIEEWFGKIGLLIFDGIIGVIGLIILIWGLLFIMEVLGIKAS
jgi:hypothetical protein